MAKLVIKKTEKNKPELVLVQTFVPKKIANLIDQTASSKEMSRAYYLRELLTHCYKEIMSGNIG